MQIRIVVAGCRDYNNYEEAKEYIDLCIEKIEGNKEIIFLSGGCSGADLLGERYAIEKGYRIEKHPAQWEKYGRAAGPKRNEEMANVCDFVICFWDGKSKGTKSMIKFAQKYEKSIMIKYV